MAHDFRKPDFSKHTLELRYENNVVCIYGTAAGLSRLAELIMDLVEHPACGHTHLDPGAMRELTKESEAGAIAVF